MKIDKYIVELTKLRQAHGPELEVLQTGFVEGAVAARVTRKAKLPRIAHMRECSRTLFRDGEDTDNLKGAKVVVI